MSTEKILVVAGAAALGLVLMRTTPARAGGPLVTLPDGTRIGPGGLIYNAQGQVVGRTTPTNYARTVALNGAATGQTAVQTLAQIKSIVGLSADIYKTITAVLKGDAAAAAAGGTAAGDWVSTAEILRDRLAADPASAAAEIASVTDDWDAIYTEANAWTFEAPPEISPAFDAAVYYVDEGGNFVDALGDLIPDAVIDAAWGDTSRLVFAGELPVDYSELFALGG